MLLNELDGAALVKAAWNCWPHARWTSQRPLAWRWPTAGLDALRKAFAAADGTQERNMLKQSFMASALVAPATSALAEGVVTVRPDFETGAGGYVQVPPDGCVWNNAVFSNGASLEPNAMGFLPVRPGKLAEL
jgi:hypothetical protein